VNTVYVKLCKKVVIHTSVCIFTVFVLLPGIRNLKSVGKQGWHLYLASWGGEECLSSGNSGFKSSGSTVLVTVT
jgi:hypothetical protein